MRPDLWLETATNTDPRPDQDRISTAAAYKHVGRPFSYELEPA